MQQSRLPATEITDVWVTGGTASGRTRLSAFDAALADAGIHNANLVRVSSITPASATRHPATARTELSQRISPGQLLPAVYARAENDVSGERLHAAVAGVRLADGYGINVEHHGVGASRAEARSRCEAMLADMAETRGQTMASDVWLRYESCTVPEHTPWGAAVAAIVYT